MTESMNHSPMDSVNEVCQRAGRDAKLKAALLEDHRGTLERETGLAIPAGWDLVAQESADGSVSVELVNGEISEEYLELVMGGLADGGEPKKSKC